MKNRTASKFLSDSLLTRPQFSGPTERPVRLRNSSLYLSSTLGSGSRCKAPAGHIEAVLGADFLQHLFGHADRIVNEAAAIGDEQEPLVADFRWGLIGRGQRSEAESENRRGSEKEGDFPHTKELPSGKGERGATSGIVNPQWGGGEQLLNRSNALHHDQCAVVGDRTAGGEDRQFAENDLDQVLRARWTGR